MDVCRVELGTASRRTMLKGSAELLAGGGIGSVMTNGMRSGSAATKSPADASPLPRGKKAVFEQT